MKGWYISEEVGITIPNTCAVREWTIDYEALRKKHPDKSEDEIQVLGKSILEELAKYMEEIEQE